MLVYTVKICHLLRFNKTLDWPVAKQKVKAGQPEQENSGKRKGRDAVIIQKQRKQDESVLLSKGTKPHG